MPGYKKYGCNAPLSVSQNFLTSSITIHSLLRRTTILASDHILEIGPGKGHITKALADRCGLVTAVELDGDLYGALRRRFGDTKNVRLVHADFLKFRLPSSGSYKVFSNIPFNRTTDILRKLTGTANPPEEIWLVTEKGAAKRFSGKPCENVRSLLLKPYFETEIVYYFKREDFHPAPSVDTVLLHLVKKPTPDIPKRQSRAYRQFIEAGLSGRLSQLLTPKQASAAMRNAGLPADFTPANMLYVQWLCLFRCRTGI
jgi:23S rRNA (adenine-N6)-dimethyltransferase